MSTTTFTVTSITGAYVVNGVNNPPLNLYRGQTYTFNINASGHPFFIQTTTPYNSANIYSNGVTGNGAQSGTLTFVVPLNAPNTLYYVCQYHSSMGNQINITDQPSQPVPCFSKGTFILTNQGYIKVEDIKEGDIVLREGIITNSILEKNMNEAPVIWVGKFTVKTLNPISRPICITKNTFGENCPFVDLYVSPYHKLLINGQTIASVSLINGETIYQDNECDSVEYYHVECHIHSAIYANGVLAETYQEWHREVFDVDN